MADLIREWYGEENVRRDGDRIRRFWAGEGRCLATLTTGDHRPRQDTGDEARVPLALAALRKQAGLPGPNIPSFFGDFGTVSNAQYWGGRVEVSHETGNPHIAPAAATLAEALDLVPRPAADPTMDAARLLRLYGRVREALGTDLLCMRMLDPSGPLNTAALILDQAELYMAMADAPDDVHRYLGRVADFVFELWRVQRQTGDRVCGAIWPYVVWPQSEGIVVTEDLMPLLSADRYGEFGLPLLRRIASEFGGLVIHCCGRYAHQVPHLRALGPALRGIEFHHPYTTIEDLEPLADTTVFIPYLAADKQDRFRSAVEFYRHLLAATPPRFRYWFACLEEDEATQAFVREMTYVAGCPYTAENPTADPPPRRIRPAAPRRAREGGARRPSEPQS